jgi:DNA-binding IclR family transcriptional regulator
VPSDATYSNSAARAIAVVEFLAAHKAETFSISELARRLGLNKSTVHGIVHTLHEAGWLFCSRADLRYGLGPTLIAVGQAADQAIPQLTMATPVMRELSSKIQRECVFSTLNDAEILILGTTGPATIGGTLIRPGARMPCNPPLGTVFMAWLDDETRKAWRARGNRADFTQYGRLDGELAAIRRRGYVVTARATPEARLERILDELPEMTSRRELHQILERHLAAIHLVEYLVDEKTPTDALVIESVQAPVFENGDGRFALTVNVDERLGARTVRDLGARVRDAAEAITDSIATLKGRRWREPAC